MQNQLFICMALGLLQEIRLISESSEDTEAGRGPCLSQNHRRKVPAFGFQLS